MEERSIALDGPAGAGKSTLARRAAEHFGIVYVDTGALYRCVGLYALRNRIEPKDEKGVTAVLPQIEIELTYDKNGEQRMLLNAEDVNEDIRLPEISAYASDISAIPAVRAFLLSMQREMAVKYDVIMDGRDIGTVVLPNAGLKIFITASPEARAKRRYLELKEKDAAVSIDNIMNDMQIRDRNDSERAVAPLKAAEDAVLLDTTSLSFEESFQAICEIISRKFGI